MNGIKEQSSVQAAEIIRGAIKTADRELVVSRSGNVRLAYGPEKLFLKLINAIDSNAREKRMDAAKVAVANKLSTELRTLGIDISTKKMPHVERLANSLVSQRLGSGYAGQHVKSDIERSIFQEFEKIKYVLAHTKEKKLKYFWKAVEHERASGRKPDIKKASTITEKTVEWAKAFGVSKKSAFNAALNAYKLKQKKGIQLEEGKHILLLAGRLSTRHNFSDTLALQFAIDNYPVLQALQVGMDRIERIIKSLDEQLPELRGMPQITRISAAIRYLQLQSDPANEAQPLDEIRKSLADLPILQQGMPSGCIIDQIHQGSHIHGATKVASNHFKELEKQTATLNQEPFYDTRSNSVWDVSFPEIFENFDEQHVKDLARGLHIELRTDDSVDPTFSLLENKRRRNPKKLSETDYQQWAEIRSSWAGSTETAATISHFQSQTFFAEVESITAEKLRNTAGYATKELANPELSFTYYDANRKHTDTGDVFELKATRYINAPLLAGEPKKSQSGDLFSQPSLTFSLAPNPGTDSPATPNAFTVKRECVIQVNADDLAKGLTRCRVIAVTEEWDIKIDWNSRRSNRVEQGVL